MENKSKNAPNGSRGTVSSFLLQGEENAIPTADLVNMIGCGTKRILQQMIANERENGVPILSTCRGTGGYYLPSDGEEGQREIETFCATLFSRAVNTLKTRSYIKQERSQVEGQITFKEMM